MSSTNRGAVRSPNDYYVTPHWAIDEFVREFVRDTCLQFCESSILDPCAGGDPDHPMAYPHALQSIYGGCIPPSQIHTIDIREDSLARDKRDYLDPATPVPPVDIIISNPPFSLATQFVDKALNDVMTGRYVVFLQRLNFFGSAERRDWWHAHMPLYTYVHSKRMGFKTPLSEKIAKELGKKPGKPSQTDSIEYAHFVWKQGLNPKWTQLRVI